MKAWDPPPPREEAGGRQEDSSKQGLSLTQAQPPWRECALVPRARVLVCSDGDELQHALSPCTVDALRPQVHQHQVVVGATWGARERG